MEFKKTSPSNYAEIMRAQIPDARYDGDQGEYRLRARIEATGIPIRHVIAADDIDLTGAWGNALNTARRAVEAGGIIALLGIRGTGKTQLATAILLGYVEKRRRCLYRKAQDLFREIRCAQSTGGDAALVSRFSAVELLILDDAHERGDTEFENRTLISIIDRRYDAMRPVIFISNQDRKAFGASVGDSIVSRMHEVGTVIECTWASFRSAKR